MIVINNINNTSKINNTNDIININNNNANNINNSHNINNMREVAWCVCSRAHVKFINSYQLIAKFLINDYAILKKL